uniref:Protein preY, mitochondrial n=2 Tax=Anolis carolinensis TaxID=28377 RepID=G1KN07_ANOCA
MLPHGLLRLSACVPLWRKGSRALFSKAAGNGGQQEPKPPFDASLLQILVCPLSKKPLRYEESTNELINEELGIAYPITDGIPNMIPQAARMIGKDKQEGEPEQT